MIKPASSQCPIVVSLPALVSVRRPKAPLAGTRPVPLDAALLAPVPNPAAYGLVETDEEPPAQLNREALRTALQVALQLNATPVSEVHVMRKMVIDGSNTSGFQRTSIVAVNGHLDSSKGSIGIPLIAIEEESAGIVSSSEGMATYRLDRLGIQSLTVVRPPEPAPGVRVVRR